MAISTAGFQGPVSETQEAGRFFRVAAPVLADSATSPKITSSGRSVALGAGSLQVCGVTIRITSTERITLTSAKPLAVLEVAWAGESSSVVFKAISASELVKNPGVKYHAVVAAERLLTVYPTLPYGGRGGRLRVKTSGMIQYVDAHDGAELVVDNTKEIWTRSGNNWVQTDEADSPWRFYDPILRYAGDGSTQAGVVNLGNGGVRRGRYKVENGFVVGEIELRTGASGSYFGVGGFSIDCPPGLVPDTYFEDRWLTAHLYTSEEAPMDWCCQGLMKGGDDKIRLWAPGRANDCRLYPAQSKNSSGKVGTGVPWIKDKFSVPITICVRLFYSLGS